MRDLLSNVHPVPAISPAAAIADNTPAESVTVDRQGYDSLTFLVLTGALADADATFAVEVQHADADWSGETAVPDGELVGTEALASFDFSADDRCLKIGYRGTKRFVRIVVTPSGNSGNAFVAAVALLGHPAIAPTANPPA